MLNQLYARLANDTSTMQSLFTGVFTSIKGIELNLSSEATGTANFAIFENNVEKVSQRVTAGQSVSWTPQAGSTVAFYVNYYNAGDLPMANATIS